MAVYQMTVATASFTLEGKPAILKHSHPRLVAEPGEFAMDGQDAELKSTPKVRRASAFTAMFRR